jgi:cytochrome b6-f complex iron-sulfur subunit
MNDNEGRTPAPSPDVGPDVPTDERDGPGVDRRRFLDTSWKVLGVALLVEAGWTSYDILRPSGAQGFGGTVDVGPVSDFLAEGSVQYFLNGRFYVTQYQGGLRALYQKCPHLGCKVPFCESSAQFECPCHGSVYNVLGEYLAGPAPRGMDRFPISIENDHVMVDTSTIVEGPPKGVTPEGPTAPAGPSCQGSAQAVGTSGSAVAADGSAPREAGA